MDCLNTRKIPCVRYAALRLVLSFALCLAVVPVAWSETWPRFRGPNGAGQSDAKNIPTEWTTEDVLWRIELPGVGHASPVVWDDRLIVTSGDPKDATRYVLCRSAKDGTELWRRTFPSRFHPVHSRNSFASSTPATDGQRVYVMWATPEQYQIVALDLKDGSDVWQRDLGPLRTQHGFGTSPIVIDGQVITTNEQLGTSFVVALDAKTGRDRWRCPRKSIGTSAYSVPCVWSPANAPEQLIVHSTAHGVSSLDPKTGKENWSLDLFRKRCVGSPVIGGGLIFGSSGSGGNGKSMVAVRPGDGRETPPELAYEITESAPYVVTPVVYGDLLFLWHDRGIVSCHDLATGTVHWRKRVGGNFSGSPVRVGSFLYCISDAGEVVVLAASKKYRLVARNDLGEPSRATPAVADGRMFLRTESHLIAIGK